MFGVVQEIAQAFFPRTGNPFGHGVSALVQYLPERIQIRGTREAARHAHHGDRFPVEAGLWSRAGGTRIGYDSSLHGTGKIRATCYRTGRSPLYETAFTQTKGLRVQFGCCDPLGRGKGLGQGGGEGLIFQVVEPPDGSWHLRGSESGGRLSLAQGFWYLESGYV